MGAAVLAIVGVGAYFGYRAYDYVEHDNEFCLTCHLMAEPYERFARSAHRDLGCKSCHKPTFAARTKMALTQVIKNPDELEAHADVPDSKCEACHVKGDPEKWDQVANTAGHRVHLQSRDPALRDLTCVKCHSSSVHEFAAADKTCAQSGCHEGAKIKLGKMSQLTLHCAVCHDFKREVTKTVSKDTTINELSPNARECLSCHQMRRLVAEQFTGNDPHDAECAYCHNPHKQATPREAVQTCESCHAAADTLTPMHRGLRAGVLQQCMQCHRAHKFEVPQNGCIGCHQDIFNDARKPVTRVTLRQQAQAGFSHGRHKQVSCQSCHNNSQRHGTVTVTTARQCQSCHHSGAPAANCGSCHSAGEYANKSFRIAQQMSFSVGQPRTKTRTVNFEHRKHTGVTCAQCHRDSVTRAAELQCASCHRDHHNARVQCTACHQARREPPHTTNVHLGCAGSGCHSKLPIAGVPRTRQFCLTCHQNMSAHRPSGNCADCHRLPTARS